MSNVRSCPSSSRSLKRRKLIHPNNLRLIVAKEGKVGQNVTPKNYPVRPGGGVIVTMLTTRGMQNSKATGSCVYTKAKAVETNSLLGAANLSLSADGVRLQSICRSVILNESKSIGI